MQIVSMLFCYHPTHLRGYVDTRLHAYIQTIYIPTKDALL